MAEEPPRGSYAIKYVCMYVCMYVCNPLKQTPVNEDPVHITPPLVSVLTGCDCRIIVGRVSE